MHTFFALQGGGADDVVITKFAASGYPWAIAYGGGKYVVAAALSGVPTNTKIYTSSDGVTFGTPTLTDSTAETYNNTCRAGIYANSKFIFIASDASSVVRSVDGDSTGATFTLRDSSGVGQGTRDIDWDGTRFIAVGGTKFTYSTTGLNNAWSDTTINGSFSGNGICYGSSLYVAVGNGGAIYTSTDRSTWTARTSGVGVVLLSVAYSSTLGMYCAVGGAGNPGVITTSTDGTSWTTQTIPSGVDALQRVRWSSSHSKFFAVSTNGKIIYSADGVTWVKSTYAPASNPTYYDIAFNGLEAVITVQNDQRVYKSASGFVF